MKTSSFITVLAFSILFAVQGAFGADLRTINARKISAAISSAAMTEVCQDLSAEDEELLECVKVRYHAAADRDICVRTCQLRDCQSSSRSSPCESRCWDDYREKMSELWCVVD